ncbi:DUF3846 domain-containing protein [Rathayibacter sp. VKM Ac-2754]|uniref:DUF3846 domain-containing protein n=1 Tax=Rathayibacter sp. VKM Ac-2754 TaxID=2609251 RepID=UPI00135CCD84|nr:DUF3846 domain-containing protein [Rathayibacter sp. VKM Ac-2754]MWV58226.1 DUF3846 domain-containing protein [Rathayibacter sp. VKM Ac-2754]
MTKAIVLPATDAPYLVDLNSAADIHALVEGWFEILDLATPDATLWINDEAAIDGKSWNKHAMWLLVVHSVHPTTNPFLRGTMVLTGPMSTNEDGLSDVDDYYVDLMFPSKRLTVHVQRANSDEWIDMRMPFDTWRSAYNAALNVQGAHEDITKFKVVPK